MENRRSTSRTKTQIHAVVRLIGNEPPHGVVVSCKGVIIDASYGGLKVVIPAQPSDVMNKLQTGDFQVIVEASRSPREKAEILGHTRWSEVQGLHVILGLRCPTMDPAQVFILGWVHGEKTKQTASTRPHWIAIIILAFAAVVQTLRVAQGQAQGQARDAQVVGAPLTRPKAKLPFAKTTASPQAPPLSQSSVQTPSPATGPTDDAATPTQDAPIVRGYGPVQGMRREGNDIVGYLVSSASESYVTDLQLTQKGVPLAGCVLHDVDLGGGVKEKPFSCRPSVAIDDTPFDFVLLPRE